MNVFKPIGMNLFDNPDLFPSPIEAIELMGLDPKDKICLEPHAGFGAIVQWMKEHGAKQVLTCEIERDLVANLSKFSNFINYDFLQVQSEDIPHVQLIAMNPPFSNGHKHVLHAWEIAPDGCEIVSMVNMETINKVDRYKELAALIDNYGETSSIGQCFKNASRPTNVEVGLIRLKKPEVKGFNFDGFFMDEDPEETSGASGLMPYNSIREIVNRYVAAVKLFENLDRDIRQVNRLTDPIGGGDLRFSLTVGFNSEHERETTTEAYAKDLQKKAWKHIFKKLDLDKYVTSQVRKNINKFVEEQQEVPFTMKNIYRMFEIIVGTREETFKQSIIEAIDSFTKHHSDNRYAVEGWKTNSGHMLNKKFIIGWAVEQDWHNSNILTPRHRSNVSQLNDLYKVICHITGTAFCYDESLSYHSHKFERGKWTNWTPFFKVKAFKKGSMHIEFKDFKVWELTNQKYAQAKGFTLPENWAKN